MERQEVKTISKKNERKMNRNESKAKIKESDRELKGKRMNETTGK